MSKKFLVDKIANKLNKKGLSYIQQSEANSEYEIDIDIVPEKFKQKHALGNDVETAFLDEGNKQLIILCDGVFIPYAKEINIISVRAYSSEYVTVHIEITDEELKEILGKIEQ